MITIAPAKIEDVEEIALLHEKVFAGFFLTSLGKQFLEELYLGFVTRSSGVMLVAREGRVLVGFAAGTTEPDTFFTGFRRQRGLIFFFRALPAIFRNPIPVVRKLFLALFYRGDAPPSQVRGALLSSIGVADQQRGKALADRLLYSFEQAVAKHGGRFVYLTTDAINNDRVNSFYRKNGYTVECRFTQSGGRPMFRYIKNVGVNNNAEP